MKYDRDVLIILVQRQSLKEIDKRIKNPGHETVREMREIDDELYLKFIKYKHQMKNN